MKQAPETKVNATGHATNARVCIHTVPYNMLSQRCNIMIRTNAQDKNASFYIDTEKNIWSELQ